MMKIADRPPGLLSRRAFEIDMGRFVIEEHWNIGVPGCPMIKNPWLNGSLNGDHFVRQVVMSGEEYAAAKPDLFQQN